MNHKRIPLLLTALTLFAFTGSALAGDHGSCSASTQACLDKMTSHYSQAGWAGLEGHFEKEKGVYVVASVVADSPAAAAGLRAGDKILGVDGHAFATMDEAQWAATKAARVPGRELTYLVKRDGEKQKVTLTLAEMPQELVAKAVGKHMVEHAQIASVQ